MRLRIGTRGSALALTQTNIVAELLQKAAPEPLEIEIVTIRTSGDRDKTRPISEVGPRGVFAVELQRALLDGVIDAAVHSLKDLPNVGPDGIVIAAVPEREDPRDVVVGRPLADLGRGAVVGTSSERRRALVLDLRPDLRVVDLRGNVDTRLAKVAAGKVDAAILAAAGLIRLQREDAIVEWLDPEVFVPSPGQGALAVETRAGELEWIVVIQDAEARAAVDSERAFAAAVEAGCTLPVGAWARVEDGHIVLHTFVDGVRTRERIPWKA